jgi:FkbM family methyltransferase
LNFGLVSIGSHTGFWLKEEIEKQVGKILLIEPVKHNLDELRQNVKNNKNVIIEECAITNRDQIKEFYYVKHSSVVKLKKHWASGIGSFNKMHILNHKRKNFQIEENDIETVNINCLSFKSLVEKYKIEKINKLIIDVEGAEYEILKSIDYNLITINQIMFEKKHFDNTFFEGPKLKETKKMLLNFNYRLKDLDKENILATKNYL